jgi:type IV pilus assembly protein PilM
MAKSGVGLDIGSYSVKLVELESEGGRYKVKNFFIKDLYGEGEEYDSEGPGINRLTTAVRQVFNTLKLSPKRMKNICTSISGPSVSVKQVKSIPLAPEEMQSSLLFEARKHLPLDESEAVIDFQILRGDMQSQDMDILLVATTKKVFDNHLKVLKEVDVEPAIIDAGTLATVNSYLAVNGPLSGEEALVFLDIGARYSNIAMLSQNTMIFSRDLKWAGSNFTDDIKTTMKVEYAEAEAIKKERGMGALLADGTAAESTGIRVARRMTMDNLIDEIRRSLRYYTKETGCREFQKILLCGGSAVLPNLNSHLASQLNMTVEKYNPFVDFITPAGFDDATGSRMAVACGLALRGL